MTRTRVVVVSAVLATLGVGIVPAHSQTPPATQPMPSVLAGRKLTPPIKGEALIEFTQPTTRREKNMIITTIVVKNTSLGAIARLTVTESWYDAGGALVLESRGLINGLLQPGEIQTITIETPARPTLSRNNWTFSHVNGTVRPQRVAKLEPPAPAKP